MGLDWYNMIAERNGGYKSNAVYSVEGESGEYEFEKRLKNMLPNFESVLDAGCGHGEFTLKMAQYAKKIVGFDGSSELLKIAKSLKKKKQVDNVDFVYANTKHKEGLSFKDEQFDLIYNRRGPTSIYNYSRILRPGGTVFSIHPGCLEKTKRRLKNGGFVDIKIEIYDNAYKYFPNQIEFAKYISAIPGNPDYTLKENKNKLQKKIEENKTDDKLVLQEWRYIVTAKKP